MKQKEYKSRSLSWRILLVLFSISLSTLAQAQSITVKGNVVDPNGEPLIGVTITEHNTTNGAITDINGNFSITCAKGATLKFSYIGYKDVTKTATGTNLKVVLTEDSQALDEVVVVGYGTQKKGSVTGSITSVDAKTIADIPTANLATSLAGRLSGVMISSTTGKPGATSSLSIRAKGTTNDSSPLYVIDGVVRNQEAFESLDASEVENISVLKDGASAAVYGARAANGVVLVTTKKGSTGKPVINYSGTVGFDSPTKNPETMSAYEQAIFLNHNRYQDWVDKGSDPKKRPENQKTWYTDDELEYLKGVNYSWLDEMWRTPLTTRHALNITGGTERVRYFIGGAYYFATGAFDNLEYNKANFRASIDANITDNFKVGLNISTDNRKDIKPHWKSDGGRDNLDNLYSSILKRSKMNPFYINGLPVKANGLEQHPLTQISEQAGRDTRKWMNTNVNMFAEYDAPFLKGLKFKFQYSRNTYNRLYKEVAMPYTLYTFETSGTNGHYIDPSKNPQVTGTDVRGGDRFIKKTSALYSDYQMNFFVTYDRTFGKHDIGALFVYEQAEGENESFDAQRNGLLTWTMPEFHAASSDASQSIVGNGSVGESGRLSYVGRLNYAYDDKYLLEAAFRVDGSTKFAPNKRWGFFPSISAGWRISNEPFFANNIKFIDYLKLRGSIASLGNDAIGGWDWMPKYNLTTGAIFGSQSYGIEPGTLANPDLTWEKSISYNVGFDGRLFNHFDVSFEWFYRHTYDILAERTASVPTSFGAKLPKENYAKIDARGFEFEIGYNGQVKDFTYWLKGNFGYAKSWWVEKDEASNLAAYKSEIGQSLDRVWGYDCLGILRSQEEVDRVNEENVKKYGKELLIKGTKLVPGMLLYRDVRGVNSDEPDGQITAEDMVVIVDKQSAPITYGFTLGGKWKGFTLDIFFQGLAGHERVIDDRKPGVKDWTGTFAYWNDHWTAENPNASMPFTLTKTNGEKSTFWVRNASFLRCKNISLSYDIPQSITKALKLDKVKVFVNGTNLFLLQDGLKIADPEVHKDHISSYPIMRNFSFGLNVTL
ncbi:SusC/RagA family TonB-linked outer membrane protein [Bacteroides clarus]|uniref:SusC/RagA family TonB-linked outer membrane protein n=2 Tax=Bacteroides clarus TaxID=626929 RepID=A0A1Y3Z9C9_9BACE|nr:TonB-dependent receptor [Bacteroides clarus]OUO03171.1 SusC/RagA family TonB-linked outer membrane protein [Bacteroides clarus]